MEVDADPPENPSTPMAWQQMNGADNEDHANGDASPVPPPHGSNPATSPPPKPSIDPEACKALGNKYFKAKDYSKAVQEYSKGRVSAMVLLTLHFHPSHFLMAADLYKLLMSTRNLLHTFRTAPPL